MTLPEAKSGALSALRHRNFRLLWCGLVVSAIGTWMQIVAQALLVLDLSRGSVVALGLVSLVQAAAFFLFALIGGAVADRVDKRRLLIVTQTLSLIFALSMAVLTACHLIAVWMILVLVFLQGGALSFDQPARAALVPLLVPRAELFNAVSLQSMVFMGASTIGPALAGLALSRIGYAGNFLANAVSYLGVIGALVAMRRAQCAGRRSAAHGEYSGHHGRPVGRARRRCPAHDPRGVRRAAVSGSLGRRADSRHGTRRAASRCAAHRRAVRRRGLWIGDRRRESRLARAIQSTRDAW